MFLVSHCLSFTSLVSVFDSKFLFLAFNAEISTLHFPPLPTPPHHNSHFHWRLASYVISPSYLPLYSLITVLLPTHFPTLYYECQYHQYQSEWLPCNTHQITLFFFSFLSISCDFDDGVHSRVRGWEDSNWSDLPRNFQVIWYMPFCSFFNCISNDGYRRRKKNKAVYTSRSRVRVGRSSKKLSVTDGRTDGPTDGPTYGQSGL